MLRLHSILQISQTKQWSVQSNHNKNSHYYKNVFLASITVDSNGADIVMTNGLPKRFSANPIYQPSEELDRTYEAIPYHVELRGLPPPLPDRNMVTPSTPSISPKLSSDERENVSSEKMQFSVNLDLQPSGGPEDQYVTMATPNSRSVSPRYTEGPVFQFPQYLETLPEENRVPARSATKVNNSSALSMPLPYL